MPRMLPRNMPKSLTNMTLKDLASEKSSYIRKRKYISVIMILMMELGRQQANMKSSTMYENNTIRMRSFYTSFPVLR